MNIYSAIYSGSSHLNKYGECKVIVSPTEMQSDKGILILHGGEDISPALYGQEPGSYTYAKSVPSPRDQVEKALVKAAIDRGYGIFGICRGAQLLTALAGGSLVQDVCNHNRDHTIDTNNGERYHVTSAHHQMCNPSGTDHQLLGWSTINLSNHYFGEDDKLVDMPIEPEVIFYPKMKALAIQPHPEWMPESSEFVQYLLRQVEEKLL